MTLGHIIFRNAAIKARIQSDPLRPCARICARMILFLLAPLTSDKIREFGYFTCVNPARLDVRRKALKALKPQF